MTIPIPTDPETLLFNLDALAVDPDRFGRASPDALLKVAIDVVTLAGGYKRAILYLTHNPTAGEFLNDLPGELLEFMQRYPDLQEALNTGETSVDELVSIYNAWRRV